MKFRRKSSAKEIHLKLFEYFRFLYDNCPGCPDIKVKTSQDAINYISSLKEGNYKMFIVPFNEAIKPSPFPFDNALFINDIVENIFNGEITFAF